MDKLELRNQIRKNELEIAQILDAVKERKSEATEVEKLNLENLRADNKELTVKLTEVEKLVGKANVIETGAKEEEFSLIRAIRSVTEGRMDYLSHPYIKAGQDQLRKAGMGYEGQIQLPVMEQRAGTGLIVAGTVGQGAETVATTKFNLMGALRAFTVFAQAGAQFLTGLVNLGSFPIYAGTTVAWATESGASANGGGTFSKVDISPKRMTAYVDISKLFLIQDSTGAEALLVNDIQKAIMVLLENTVLGTAAASASQPGGIFNGVTFTAGGTNGALISGTTTWAMTVGLESNLLTNNKVISDKTAAYVIHPSTNGIVKTTAKASNQAIFIREGNSINGYPVYVTSNMPSLGSATKGAVFADWSDLIIGQWGGIDITVDPYSQAVNGNIRLVVNVYFDAKFRRSVSYALAALK